MLIFVSKKKWQALCEVVDRIDEHVEQLSAGLAALRVRVKELEALPKQTRNHRREVKQRIDEMEKKIADIARKNKR